MGWSAPRPHDEAGELGEHGKRWTWETAEEENEFEAGDQVPQPSALARCQQQSQPSTQAIIVATLI